MKDKKIKLNGTIIYVILITLFAIYVLLDAFIIPRKYDSTKYTIPTITKPETAIIEENRYIDENISIQISYDRIYDTNLYIADVQLKDVILLKSAFAADTYGRNILQPTSTIATLNKAILAINGDYYGYRDNGFVVRNGIFYRDTVRDENLSENLFFYSDGSTKIFNEQKTNLNNEISKAEQDNNPIWQVFSFGPAIIKDCKIQNSTKDRDITTNPRTAIGIIEPLHYVFVCCDGRQDESIGLTTNQLAEYMLTLNCQTAYNLDGGGSTTIYFNGKILNNPSDGFERPVSDIVYIGY